MDCSQSSPTVQVFFNRDPEGCAASPAWTRPVMQGLLLACACAFQAFPAQPCLLLETSSNPSASSARRLASACEGGTTAHSRLVNGVAAIACAAAVLGVPDATQVPIEVVDVPPQKRVLVQATAPTRLMWRRCWLAVQWCDGVAVDVKHATARVACAAATRPAA
eukprot:6197206-Pleurochrysis_carterae.AAC.4